MFRVATQAMVICCALAVAGAAEPQAVLPRGHAFYRVDFEKAATPDGNWGEGKIIDGAMCFSRAETGVGSSVSSVSLPVEQMRGYTVYCRARIRAQNISRKPQPWNGVKFMLAIDGPAGRTWPASNLADGSFDWQDALFSARIPADATSVRLVVGLEQVSGRAWFDDIRITVGKAPASARIVQVRPGPMYKGHDLPRLRGVMIATTIDEQGLRVLGEQWNANLIRWQLIRSVPPGRKTPLAEYDTWLEGELKKLDAAIPLCRSFGLKIALDLHSPPGGKRTISGYIGSDDALFTDRLAQAKFVGVWEHMARRYKNNDVIWGFDLANEPVEGVVADDCDDWHALATRAARAVHAIDPDRTIIIEPADWGSPDGLVDFHPIDEPNVVYSVHMYVPHEFTHQSVHGGAADVRYPGVIGGRQWDKAQLESALSPVVEFQKKYNVHIYIGEFSAIRWAPDNSAHRYLKDVIDIFEGHGWDWSYHAFREWQGWSVEHGEERVNTHPATRPTDRQRLLTQWFAKNQKSR